MAKNKAKKRGGNRSSHHDEHKVLMFAIGIAFGISLCAMVYQFWYPALASLAILIVLFMMERREKS